MHTVKVFKSGNSQAVRIPKEFSVKDSELYIQKVGNSIILTSKHDPWQTFRNSLDKFSNDLFSDGRDQPENQEREEFQMYLLDTNICIYLIKKKFKSLQDRIEKEDPYKIALSSITVAELEYGIAKSLYPERNRETLLEFLSSFEIIPFNELDCETFGFLRAYLNKQGVPIGPYDLQIASQCVARNLCIVTNNVKEFERVPNLKIENWTVQEPD